MIIYVIMNSNPSNSTGLKEQTMINTSMDH